ncbi:PREDICTED: DNA polymerase alpha catalytic subunit isoform X2 [Nicrophorus vespilloides]|uniref:DNA polymerase n=1 Tax=Nicrophorus vespilloides TaxID=110193 RepID=A0ABM1NCU0_NICVS|nr:PREDICTED: DNA polymerase alpha catalytic subunit isoform X2 [Nicrophorus vespilloides]
MSDEIVAEPRVKRQKTDKFGRFAALQKLKELKGSKHKYEVDEIDNVYDNVDENEYTKRILERQDDDWIVDDGGSGYVEDGREVFDDDLDSESIANASMKSKGKKRKKKHVSENSGKGKIQFMMSNLPNKKKDVVNLDEDNVLSELLTEIDKPDTKIGIKPKAISNFSLIAEKKAIGDYMKNFAASKPKVRKEINCSSTTNNIEEEIGESSKTESVIEDSKQPQTSNLNDSNKKSKLLFQIAEPIKTISKVENIKIEAEELSSEIFFDDDFDFSQIDDEPNIHNIKERKTNDFVDDLNFGDNEDIFDDLTVDMSEMNHDTNSFTFFWWDAYEDAINKPGVVLLFGKTFSEKDKKFISCCVVIKNIERKIFLLPRKYKLNEAFEPTCTEVTFEDVYEEFNTEMKNNDQILSYKSKKVMKHYAFDSTVPIDSEYLEVRYTGNINFLNKRFYTISRIFGANSGFLEILLLDRKIKGPCWLSVKNADISMNPYTYSTIEMTCEKYSNISVIQATKPLPPPPLVVLALNIKLAVNINGENQIALISSLINNRYYVDKQAPTPPFQEHFCVLTKLNDQMLPVDMHSSLSKYKATKVQKMDSERALLNYFLGQFSKIDPDLIVGHDMNGYQLNILGERLMKTNVQNFSRLSKIKRSNGNFNKYNIEKSLFAGRLVCDIKLSAKELIKSRSYDLDSLCQYILKLPEGHRIEIEPENVPSMYTNSLDLFKMISLTMQDTAYILKMMYELSVLPLALQITNIAGNVMSKTLMGGRSERNEYLLMHAFNERDYIVPEKYIKRKDDFEKSNSKRKKPAYSGGLVLDPKIGFYDKLILLMDFNSLYPSIIQEYNICFTTINLSDNEDITLPDKSIPPGILPSEIRKLVESRREVKKLMNNSDLSQDLQMQYNIRQMALKLTANSMYGCLGFSNSRFYAKPLAALVTQKGREILINTKDIAQKLMFDVIYGDTDSIMINTNSNDYEQVFKIGKSIKQEINKMYKQVELDIDGVFKYLLLLKKKKYAAVSLVKGKHGQLNEIQEIKGLDIVRRDWSQLAASAGRIVLNQILCEQSPDERVENIFCYLSKLKEEIVANKVPLQLLVITKQLTKNPALYADSKSLPHVQVALRHNKKKGKKFKAGDTVPYIICNDGTNNPATQRAYLIEELKTSTNLKIDTNYYLAQQIHPVISRICEPIQGTSAYEIANCLDIQSTNFVKKPSEISVHESFKLDKTFRNAEPFKYNCIGCKEINSVSSLLVNNKLSFEKCTNSECNIRPAECTQYIQNELVKTIRNFIKRYYSNELTCEDPGCPNNTARLPQSFVNKYPICTLCKSGVMYKRFTENDLYSQLMSYKQLFDISKVDKKSIEPALELLYNNCKMNVENVLKSSGFCTIDLKELFDGFTITSKQNKNTAGEYLDLLNTVDDEYYDSEFQ